VDNIYFDGVFGKASFGSLGAIDIDKYNNLYVVDTSTQSIRYIFTSNLTVQTIAAYGKLTSFSCISSMIVQSNQIISIYEIDDFIVSTLSPSSCIHMLTVFSSRCMKLQNDILRLWIVVSISSLVISDRLVKRLINHV
jgi:hypothetical protein